MSNTRNYLGQDINTENLTPSASETQKGIVQFATTVEAKTLTEDTKSITTKKVVDMFNASGTIPLYACRTWVIFKGTGAVTVKGSGNVSSVTDNGVGNYTINFITPFQDLNYASFCTSSFDIETLSNFSYNGGTLVDPRQTSYWPTGKTTTSFQIFSGTNRAVSPVGPSARLDFEELSLSFFR